MDEDGWSEYQARHLEVWVLGLRRFLRAICSKQAQPLWAVRISNSCIKVLMYISSLSDLEWQLLKPNRDWISDSSYTSFETLLLNPYLGRELPRVWERHLRRLSPDPPIRPGATWFDYYVSCHFPKKKAPWCSATKSINESVTVR